MRITKQPAHSGGRVAGNCRDTKYFNKQNYTGTPLERAIKNWAIDKLVERFYEGKNTPEHRHAVRFWKRAGRRLTHV